ncbi:MAG: GTP-binding protein [Hyphomonadaceae bacterium]|nr:MAG: GTP-binding protein [Hyphomonadaceae bacterium]KAF0185306.1 MAG: GTP-binding protein [Hyphomonadaceae bacterium]
MAIKTAILGRPNVGKSTLFNRLAGRKLAIVDDMPGVTRDRREAKGRLGDLDLALIDTAGFEEASDESLESRMREQTEAAIAEAEICLFVVDARSGITPIDEQFAALLRKSEKPVLVLANKSESKSSEAGVMEAYSLGLGEPIPVSAEHGEGMSDLYSAILNALGEKAGADLGHGEDEENPPLRLAIIGRPNAGKSTLINAMLGDERVITGAEAGITRDSIGIDWEYEGKQVRLVDTAGMRRKSKVQAKLEVLSVADTIRTIRFAEICVLVMGADEAFEKQDMQIADLVAREGRGLIYLVSKWDTVENPAEKLIELKEKSEKALPELRGAPMIVVSSLSGIGLEKLMPAVLNVHEDWNARIKTRDLNDWLKEAVAKQPPPSVEGKRIKPRYIAQIKARPPTFVLLASRAAQLPETYVRYLTNGIRVAFDMPAVPIRFFVRAPKNPFIDGDDGAPRPRVSNTKGASIPKPEKISVERARKAAGAKNAMSPKRRAKKELEKTGGAFSARNLRAKDARKRVTAKPRNKGK